MTTLFTKFLQWLQSHMYEKYGDLRLEFERSLRDDINQLIWVHELNECPEKARLETEFPQLAETVRFKPAVMLGELVHVALEKYTTDTEYIPKIYHKILDVDGEKIMIAGTPDYVSFARSIVVDFKYSIHIGQKPLQHHITQVALYKWLCDVKHGELWYFTHDSFKAFPVLETVSDSDVINMIRDNQIPRWPEWECKFCEFRQLCRYG